jgi:fatty-acyl-CoA synthase
VDLDLRAILEDTGRLVARFGDEAYYVALCVRSGLIGVEMPHRVALMLRAFDRFGTLGGAVSVASIRSGGRIGLVDELGSLSFRELDRRSNALAHAWRERGLEPGETVTILARNHRGFLDAVFAAAKCGARIVLLNTGFGGAQIRRAATREGTDLLVYDDEFARALKGVEPGRGRWRAWSASGGDDTLEALIDAHPTSAPPKPGVGPRIVIPARGGKRNGATESDRRRWHELGGLLSKVPLHAREVTECGTPMCGALGFAHAMLAVSLGSTLVLRRRFDPAATLDSLDRNQATGLVVAPVMLQRMLDLGEDARAALDLRALRVVLVAGSQLGAELCRRTVEALGPVVYNVYGSTETVYATIATPADLAAEPACVGKVVRGSIVKVLDQHGEELPPSATGRIFIGTSVPLEAPAVGARKTPAAELRSSGDVGHFDAEGRLFVEGRGDETILSGGRSVFPREVEEVLAGHPAIEEAAAVGVPDHDLGQRLRAFVVVREGASMTEDEVKEYVSEKLAGVKSPREVVFLAELPRSPAGRVLKRRLERLPVG